MEKEELDYFEKCLLAEHYGVIDDDIIDELIGDENDG